MGLKNITDFNRFKKVNEEADFGGHDFSNSTGFSKSLVGRGIFSLARYFKKGIDTFRMEFFKRELENEYFAAVLRFCEKYKIDLKTGYPTIQPGKPEEEDSESQSQSQEQPQPQEKTNKCDVIASQDPIILQLKKPLPQFTKDDTMVALNQLGDVIDKDGKIIVDMSKASEALNKIENVLSNYRADLTPQQIQVLEKVRDVLKRKTKLTESEYYTFDNVLFDWYGTTDFDEYEVIDEAIGGVMNRAISIKKVLGESLPNGSKFGSFKMGDVNWEGLAKYCSEHPNPKIPNDIDPKRNIARLVNKNAVKQIQYGISRIIYHTHRTPSFLGVNPGEGGGVKKQSYGGDTQMDTGLKNRWDKIVSNILSQFSAVMVTESEVKEEVVNPYKIITMEEAYRSEKTGGDKSSGQQVLDRSDEALFIILFQNNKTNLYIESISDLTDKEFGLMLMKHNENYFVYGIQSSSFEVSGGTRKFNYLYSLDLDKLSKDINAKTLKNTNIWENYRYSGDTILKGSETGIINKTYSYTQLLPLLTKLPTSYKDKEYLFRNKKDNDPPSTVTNFGIQNNKFNGVSFTYTGGIDTNQSTIPVESIKGLKIVKIFKITNNDVWRLPNKVFPNFDQSLKNIYKKFTFR